MPGETLALHWDGTAWAIVPTPNRDDSTNELFAVTATSPSDAWAVGAYENTKKGITRPLAMLDGTGWTIARTPTPGGGRSALGSFGRPG